MQESADGTAMVGSELGLADEGVVDMVEAQNKATKRSLWTRCGFEPSGLSWNVRCACQCVHRSLTWLPMGSGALLREEVLTSAWGVAARCSGKRGGRRWGRQGR